MTTWDMRNWSNEELLDQIITRANQVSIISESNELHDMRRELLDRMAPVEGEA